mgnify:CR=1 FL=1
MGLLLGLMRWMFGPTFVRAAFGSCLEFCVVQQRNCSVPTNFHINCMAENSISAKFSQSSLRSSNLKRCLLFWRWYKKARKFKPLEHAYNRTLLPLCSQHMNATRKYTFRRGITSHFRPHSIWQKKRTSHRSLLPPENLRMHWKSNLWGKILRK